MTEVVAERMEFKDVSPRLQSIAQKIHAGQRINAEEGLALFEEGPLPFVGALANFVREKMHGHKTYFNRNFHIEPTNVCVFSCKFCSYSRLYAHREEGWELSMDDMLNIVKRYDGKPVTEVHIVGGVHPKMNLYFFADLLKDQSTPSRSAYKSFYGGGTGLYVPQGKTECRRRRTHFTRSRVKLHPGGGAEIFDRRDTPANLCR